MLRKISFNPCVIIIIRNLIYFIDLPSNAAVFT